MPPPTFVLADMVEASFHSGLKWNIDAGSWDLECFKDSTDLVLFRDSEKGETEVSERLKTITGDRKVDVDTILVTCISITNFFPPG